MAGKATGVAASAEDFIYAPLTGGLSLALTGAGIAIGLFGAVTSTASEITDAVSNK